MTTKEIVKAAKAYVRDSYGISIPQEHSFDIAINAFKEGVELANKHWQEKTRWRSLLTEPPTNYTYDKMYLLRTESGSPYLVPLPYKESVKEFISCGFIEWKEIEL